MIKTTIWRPDTCGCEIQYTWDDSVPQEERVHSGKSIKKCEFHKSMVDIDAHVKVKKENTSKNIIEGHILENHPEVVDEYFDDDGAVHKKFKQGIKYEWSFDANRDLVFNLKGATQKTKDDILTEVKIKLDDSKIKIK